MISPLPVGVVNNTNEKAYKEIRKNLTEKQKLRAVIYMPGGVFKPYSGVQTAIIIFDKTDNGGTDKVWLYNMETDGFSLDDKRNPVEENDIPDIIERFNNPEKETERTPYDKSFFITKQDIIDNDYIFTFSKYHKQERVKVKYRPTKEVLSEIEALNNQFVELFQQIKLSLVEESGEEN